MAVLSEEVFKHIRRIEIETARLAEDMMVGLYHSAFKGQGMEFEEVREYVAGDDVRSVDWNVTARMGSPYVKSFKEERELTVFLLVDISASVGKGGSGSYLKRSYIAELASLLAMTAVKNSDKVGLILFSDRVEKYLPPKKGWRHVLRVIRELLVFEAQGSSTDIAAALSFLAEVQHRTAVVFILSDYLCPMPRRQIAVTARRHDLIALSVEDPVESKLPDMGLVPFYDPESGKETIVDCSDSKQRDAFEAASVRRRELLVKELRRLGASTVALTAGSSYVAPLRAFFQMRRIRH